MTNRPLADNASSEVEGSGAVTKRTLPKQWWIYQGDGESHADLLEKKRPAPPPWRAFDISRGGQQELEPPTVPHLQVVRRFGSNVRGEKFVADDKTKEMVNAALYLRRPLLVTGKPGTGKSSLAYAVAHELGLGAVLVWPINSRSNLQDALYQYDAIGRLQATNFSGNNEVPYIGDYITLGPLGTALLPYRRPRVLLIDEIDKSDIDLPSDLLHIFEDGYFEIPELARLARVHGRHEVQAASTDGLSTKQTRVTVRTADGTEVGIEGGRVNARNFPFVVITSNGERELPAPFLRRCLRLDIDLPRRERLEEIVDSHFDETVRARHTDLITNFLEKRDSSGLLATDQLLNAIYLANAIAGIEGGEPNLREGSVSKDSLLDALMRRLDSFS